MKETDNNRMKELVAVLNHAAKVYYAQDTEVMSNFEYDRLYDELVELEKRTGVTLANSPTVNVGLKRWRNCRKSGMSVRCSLLPKQRAGKNCETG